MSKSGARIIKAAGEAVLHAQVERLQADVARLTAERDAALALVAAAYEAAADEVDGISLRHWKASVDLHGDTDKRASQLASYTSRCIDDVGTTIRALTPADALAAQAARDERMRAEGRAEAEARGRLRGIEEAADKFRDCWDDPEAEDDGFAHNTEVAIRALGERGRLCRQPDDIKTR